MTRKRETSWSLPDIPCSGTTEDGSPCPFRCVPGESLCFQCLGGRKPSVTEDSSGQRDVRGKIAADAARLYDERISRFFENALDSEKSIWVACKSCGKRTEAKVPDWSARGNVLRLMLESGFGRPGTNDGPPPRPKKLDEIASLSDEELAALVEQVS
jgi:hypothetical protein